MLCRIGQLVHGAGCFAVLQQGGVQAAACCCTPEVPCDPCVQQVTLAAVPCCCLARPVLLRSEGLVAAGREQPRVRGSSVRIQGDRCGAALLMLRTLAELAS